jgi:predicted nucleic acid-binding protein
LYLIDTNVLSELRRLNRANPNVATWADSVLAVEMYVSAISVLELEVGVLRAERRDVAKGVVLRRWLDRQVMPAFDGKILAIDVTVARRCAALHVPNPRADRDAWIAATALVYGFTVVTRNVADFAPMGVPLLNPWNGEG